MPIDQLCLSANMHTDQSNLFQVPSDTDALYVDQSKNQRATRHERVFMERLIKHLEANNITCELAVQEKLVVPLKSKRASAPIKQQLKQTVHRFKYNEFTIRQPDFMIMKYGLVFEIDGEAHDSNNIRVQRDNARDAEYKILGFDTFVIQNRQVYGKNDTIFKEIIDQIRKVEADPNFKKMYNLRRKLVSRSRKAFKKRVLNLISAIFVTDKRNHLSQKTQKADFSGADIAYRLEKKRSDKGDDVENMKKSP